MTNYSTQRRLAAILAADVASYTQLMEKDSDGTVAAWQAARDRVIDPTIGQHSGRLVKFTGDGFLAEFPTVQDAVTCAVALQEQLAQNPLEFRMGVNLGDIIDDGKDIHGEGINVAARLEGLAKAGGICVSGEVHTMIRNRLDYAFEDLGEHAVKHVTHPVRVYAIRPGNASAVPAAPKDTDRPSIAVLPFENLSNDPEQEYFSDGMAEDLITDISKISGVFVTARNSSFAFKGQAVDVKEIARNLTVKHILEGSVRKMGRKLRINAQLIDAASGGHLWAERYDGDMENIFEFQDNIREQIVLALQVKLTPTDKALAERKPTDSVEAYDLFLKGRAKLYNFRADHVLEAIKYFENALEIDPHFADAYSYLAYCHFARWVHMWPGFDENLDRANKLAERGVALNDMSAIALARLGSIQRFLRRYDLAIANLEKALTLAPNNAEVIATFGQVFNTIGNPERGLEMLEKVFTIDTFPPPNWELYAGTSYFLLGRYEEALVRINRVIDRVPSFIPSYPILTSAYVELGRLDNAHDAIKTFLDLAPQITLKKAADRFPFRIDKVRSRFLETLCIAGLPE